MSLVSRMEALAGLSIEPERHEEPSPAEEIGHQIGFSLLLGAVGLPPVAAHALELGHELGGLVDQLQAPQPGPSQDPGGSFDPGALGPADALRPGPRRR